MLRLSCIAEKWEIRTRTDNCGQLILPDIADTILKHMDTLSISREEVTAIGVGVPAPVYQNGICGEAVNLGWQQKDVKQELEALTREMGLDKWVDFHGYVKNPYGYMANADCVVLSSHYEGLPTVLVEALACGSRIVSTDCPSGPAEILQKGKYGLLVPVEDGEALAQGILTVMKTRPQRERLQARAMDFTVERATEAFENQLLQLV